jgi:hypothetical protein
MKNRLLLASLAITAAVIGFSCSLFGGGQDDTISWTTVTVRLIDGSDSPFENTVVIAADTSDGRTYSGISNNQGVAVLQVPRRASIMLSLVGSDGRPLAPITYETDARGRGPDSGEIYTGLIVPDSETGLDLGEVIISSDVTKEPLVPSATGLPVDTAVKAALNDGVPAGVGKLGKIGRDDGLFSLANKADPDGDGLPNVIDADDDNDGILDDMDEDDDGDGVADASSSSVPPVEFSIGYLLDIRGVADGLKNYFDDDPAEVVTGLIRDMRVDLMVQINDSARIDALESVALLVSSSPTYASELNAVEFDTADPTQEFADGSSYTPPSGQLSAPFNALSNTAGIQYQIPVNQQDDQPDRRAFRVALKLPDSSSELFEEGDTFTIELRYTAESALATEYCSGMINFVYDNVTRFQARAVNSSSSVPPAPGDFVSMKDGSWGSPYPGDAANPITVTYADPSEYVWFKIIPPVYDDETYILEGGFRYEMFNSSGSRSWSSSGSSWRYDSNLADEYCNESVTPPYFAVPIPIQYILDTDAGGDNVVEIEYFMNINEDSYIVNFSSKL